MNKGVLEEANAKGAIGVPAQKTELLWAGCVEQHTQPNSEAEAGGNTGGQCTLRLASLNPKRTKEPYNIVLGWTVTTVRGNQWRHHDTTKYRTKKALAIVQVSELAICFSMSSKDCPGKEQKSPKDPGHRTKQPNRTAFQ